MGYRIPRMVLLASVLVAIPACKSQPKTRYSTRVPTASPLAHRQPGPVVEPVRTSVPVAKPKTSPVVRANPTPLKPVKTSTPPEKQAPKTAPVISEGPVAIKEGRAFLAAGQLIKARAVLNKPLVAGKLSDSEAAEARAMIAKANETLVFSSEVRSGDTYALRHTIARGEYASTIARKYHTDWAFVSSINNGLSDRKIRVGRKLKVIRGPFHVVVDKSDYRLDLFMGKGVDGGSRMYVRSFRVGLGAAETATPVGLFQVSKRVVNPGWVHPESGKYYKRDDPKNPIGERWVGLRGMDSNTRNKKGYGLHGTIENSSVGGSASMGCVRMLHDDIVLVHSMMEGNLSQVRIVR
jgi:lipoprotein-anchoring transpeptidase ErfK/SrfK